MLATSDPTLRAVFAEDAAALIGLLIAAAGLAGHQITGSAMPDAIGSILVGVLLGVVAIVLINRNRQFLVGQEVEPAGRRQATLHGVAGAARGGAGDALRLEFIGPRQVYLVADVDLTGDDTETHLAIRLRALEARMSGVAGRGGLHAQPVRAGRALAGGVTVQPARQRRTSWRRRSAASFGGGRALGAQPEQLQFVVDVGVAVLRRHGPGPLLDLGASTSWVRPHCRQTR